MSKVSDENEIAEVNKLANLGMWMANSFEKQGLPFLLSVFFLLVLLLILQLNVVQEFFVKHFKGEVPKWYVVATWAFLLFLTFVLIVQKMWRASWRYVKHCHHCFIRLQKDGVINQEESENALQVIFANYILGKIGGPEKIKEINNIMENDEFHKMFNKMFPFP